jgi:predicted transposase YbfD/YdcC
LLPTRLSCWRISTCDDKSNEIPGEQTLLGALGLIGALVTVDAMHCQKKRSNEPLQAAFI